MGGGREVLEGGEIYIYIYIYIYTHIYTHTHIYIYIYTHTHTAMTDTRCIAETSTMQSNYPIKKKK